MVPPAAASAGCLEKAVRRCRRGGGPAAPQPPGSPPSAPSAGCLGPFPRGSRNRLAVGQGTPSVARASLPSVSGGVGRGLLAPTSPPWLTLRGSAAGTLLPGRGRLLLQPSRPPGSGSPLGSGRMKEHRGWSELVPCGSAGSSLPRAFQAGWSSAGLALGSITVAGLRKGASAGKAGQSCGCPAVTATGDVSWCWEPACSHPGDWVRGWVSICHHQGWAPMGAGHPPEGGTLPGCLCPPVSVGSCPHAVLLGASRGDRVLCPGGWCDPPSTHQ